MRRVLSLYCDDPPERLVFATGPKGKPALERRQNPRDIRFNLSHSGEAAVLVVAAGREGGVDIEPVETPAAMDAAVEYAFTAR